MVNGVRIGPRPVEHVVHASLSTELYNPTSQSWKKPSRRTAIHLVRTRPGETATIYEMGIPVAALEWSVPFHCDIQQRVPMNPNRDAVASGYPLKLHVACLPTLLEQMDEETIKHDWVGSAGRHFDEDARELGVQVINTAQTSGGFREMLKAFVPPPPARWWWATSTARQSRPASTASRCRRRSTAATSGSTGSSSRAARSGSSAVCSSASGSASGWWTPAAAASRA